MKKTAFGKMVLAVFGCGLTLGVQAYTVTTTSSTSPFIVSSDDLLQKNVSSISDSLSLYTELGYSGGPSSWLTDGTAGAASSESTCGISGGSIVYTLDTSKHAAGYDISAITTYAGWNDGGRDGQNYEVSFRKVGSSEFVDAITNNYGGSASQTRVSITGLNETGVEAIKFTFLNQENGGVGYKELDVFGTAPDATATVTQESRGSAYTVSSADLLQTALSSTDNAISLFLEDGYSNGGAAALTDGYYGSNNKNDTCGITGGTITYWLNTAANPAGYNVTAVDTYTGWNDAGRDDQHYTVSFRRVGSSVFSDTYTVSYAGTISQTHVGITNLNLTGVEAVRFAFLSQENGGVGYKELDVSGSAPDYTEVTRRDSGTQVIASNTTAVVRIVEGTGTPVTNTLGSAVTVVDSLSQSAADGAAAIDPAGQTLALNGLYQVAGAGGLTIGIGANNGKLAALGSSLLIGNASANDIVVNAAVTNGAAASELVKSGSGRLTLTAANQYSGGTTVSAGTLRLSGAGTLGSGFVSVGGGVLQVDGGSVAPAYGSGWALTFTNATLNQTAGSLSYGGYMPVSDSTLNLSGGTSHIDQNALLGWLGSSATVNISGTHVADWYIARLLGGTATVNLQSGGKLYSDKLYSSGATGVLAFDGGVLGMSSHNSGYSASDWISASSGSMTLLVGNGGAVIDTANGSATINRPFLRNGLSTGGLTKTGANTLTLTCTSTDELSTYVGDTLVQGGTLKLTTVPLPLSLLVNAGFESPAQGASGWSYVSSDGVSGGWTMSEHTTDNGTGIANNWAPWVNVSPEGSQVAYLQQAASIYQTFTVPETAVYKVFFYASNRPGYDADNLAVLIDDVTMASIAYGTLNNGGSFKAYQVDLGTLTAGPHVLKFVGSTPGHDATTTLDMVRIVRASGALPGSLPVGTRATVSPGATLELNGASQTLAELSGGGSVVNSTATNVVLAVGGDNGSAVFAGTVRGPVSFVKTGTGTLTLSGPSTYSGETVVAGGTVTLSPEVGGTPGYATANAFTFSPAANNLLAGLLPSDVSNSSAGVENTGPASVLTDGVFGLTNLTTYAVADTSVITYTLSADNQGSDVSQINIFSGWNDGGRDRITVSSISYSTVSSPDTFVAIPNSAVDYDCTDVNLVAQQGLAVLSAGGGLLATNVYAIRFNFGPQENGHVGYRELEVIGTHNLLPTGSVVTVAAGAALNLNGNSQKFAGLAGSGTVTNGTLAVNGVIAPGGTNVIGTLTLAANVTLSGTLLIDTALDGTCDLFQVQGALDLSGLALQIQNLDQIKASRQYLVAACTPGALTGKFVSTNLGEKRSVYYDVAGGRVMLIGRGLLLSIR